MFSYNVHVSINEDVCLDDLTMMSIYLIKYLIGGFDTLQSIDEYLHDLCGIFVDRIIGTIEKNSTLKLPIVFFQQKKTITITQS